MANPPSTRRHFLRNAVIASASAGFGAAAAPAIEPIRRTAKPQFRLSLAAYSFRQALNLKKPTMTLDGFIDMAAGLPLDAVELTGYYFAQTTNPYLAGLKGRCTRLGLDISGTAVRNDFCTTDSARLKTDIAHVKTWIEHTSRLGGKSIRIFAGTIGKGDTEERARTRCVAAIEEVCAHAGQFGIYVALENHGGITATPDLMLPLVRAVKSDWFGVNLDTGNFHVKVLEQIEVCLPYAVSTHIKTEMRRDDGATGPADWDRIFSMFARHGYKGYMTIEYEAKEDPNIAVPRACKRLRELAARYSSIPG